jgi:hypothetical protein
MSYREPKIGKGPTLKIMFYLFLGLMVVALWAGLAELAKLRQPSLLPDREQPLAGALRAGTPEFEQYRKRIVLGQPQALVASHSANNLALELTTSVRNETGRIIKGLELRGTVVDPQGSPVGRRVAIIIPTQQTAIEPDEAIKARLLLEDVRPEAKRAGARVEVTGVIFD